MPLTPHNTGLYVPAGKGRLYIAEWVGTTPPTYPGLVPTNFPTAAEILANPGDFEDVGNCPSLEVEPTTEKRPHYSSRAGMRTKDLNPTVGLEYAINFDLDEMAASNMKRFLLGTYNATTGIISGLDNANAEYAIIFVSDNPIGPNQIKYFRRVTLMPNGPLQLIGEEYLVMSFAGEGLSAVTQYPTSSYFDVKYVTTTTTSTTTTTTTTTMTA